MSTARVLTRNIFSNWMNLGVNILIGFFMMPFLVSRLGDTLYGIWILVVSVVGYGNLLDLGVRSSIVKYVSQHHAAGDRHQLNRLFSTTVVLYSGIGMILLLVFGGLAWSLPQLFRIPADLTEDARLVLLIVGLNLALKFPAGVFEGFLAGLQRYEIANGIAIVCNLLRAAATVASLLHGQKLLALAAVGLAGDVIMGIVMAFVCWRLLPWLTLRRSLLGWSVVREIYTYGLWSFVIAMASRVLYDSDSILIGMFLPAAAITPFAVANNLIRYVRQLAYGFGNVFSPAASALEARQERDRLQGLVTHGTRYAAAVVLPVALCLALVGPEFLALWMGPRFIGESGGVLVILAVSQAMVMAQFPAGSALYGLNRHRQLAFLLLVEGSVKVILSVALLPSYGVMGVALGTAVPEVLASWFVMPVLITRCAGLSLWRYLRDALLPPLLCLLPAGALLLGLKEVIVPDSWDRLIAVGAAGLFTYGIFAICFCLDRPQRLAVRRFFFNPSPGTSV